MLRLVYLILALFIVVFGVVFSVLNADKVQLHYYLGSIELPLSLILIFAMIAGAVLGVVASLSFIIGARRNISKLKRSVDVAEKEIANLRNIPIRNEH